MLTILMACSVGVSGCGSTDSTPGTGSAAESEPLLAGYTFPSGIVKGKMKDHVMYTRMEGVLALPSSPGPHPVAVLVHGSYPGCIDATKDKLLPGPLNTFEWPEACETERASQEDGLTTGPDYFRAPASWAYLAQELAKRGFAVVMPDVHAKEEWWTGEPNPVILQTELVKAHLQVMADLNDGKGHDLPWAKRAKGAFDFSQVALIGHSSGGGYVLTAARKGLVPNLKAVVALEPAYQGVGKPVMKAQLPVLVAAGECDEQVGWRDPRSAAGEFNKANPSAPIIFARLSHTTHIGMVTGGGSHKIGLITPSTSPRCADAELATVEQMQGQTALITGEFLTDAFAGKTDFALQSFAATALKVKSLNPGAATVSTTDTTALPGIVDPTTIKFSESSDPILPPLPEGMKLIVGTGGDV